MSTLRVQNLTRGTSLGERISLAATSAERRTGLLKHPCLHADEGLWIVPCSGVHTFFMKFDIDLVYVDRKHRVRKVVSQVRPWRMSLCPLAYSVVELPAGTIERSGTRTGDALAILSLVDGSEDA
jgi:uncharacterized protein